MNKCMPTVAPVLASQLCAEDGAIEDGDTESSTALKFFVMDGSLFFLSVMSTEQHGSTIP